MPYLLTVRTWLPLAADRVFAFFGDAANLDRLTPPWLQFRLESPVPVAMAPGALIDYRLRLRGVPIRWRTEVTEWNPPHGFVDEQRRGPYRWWIHTHSFVEADEGTEMVDTVDYQPRGGPLLHAVLVGPELRRIFAYRHEALVDALGLEPASTRPTVSIVKR